ncbi:QcrA and Rieske domain-containing protein [Rhodococcus chondri]|uniref:Cytochrome bc1 complex Rieske iron-sulfur subunit n=1 Tax=Rhodococcus chondri TaxID=3065941 RepID=A0ABU7JPF2_9NOCA|nr:Rieske (2Fe-2S) protein [Rhodococcus sp. CC-R104]MEE2031913.1 Rieske (2Fe-2S) protein [Rhodococcus sp. CC-R104]
MNIDLTSESTALSRRALLGSAGVVAATTALTACGGASDAGGDRAQPPVATTTSPPGPDAEVVAATADVPIGGAVLLTGKRLVLSQPTAGDFHAFIAVCTHQGCNITGVEDDLIVCNCHGSTFALDGAPVAGPAKRPLKSRPIEARGTDLVVG